MLEGLNGYSFILAVLNLLILYFVLRKILFGPVTQYMEKRSKSIQDALDDAQRQKAEADASARLYESKLKEADARAREIVDAAALKAGTRYDQLTRQAEEEARRLIENAGKAAELEREKLLDRARGEIAALALAAASKLIEANLDTQSNAALVDRFLEEVGAA